MENCHILPVTVGNETEVIFLEAVRLNYAIATGKKINFQFSKNNSQRSVLQKDHKCQVMNTCNF